MIKAAVFWSLFTFFVCGVQHIVFSVKLLDACTLIVAGFLHYRLIQPALKGLSIPTPVFVNVTCFILIRTGLDYYLGYAIADSLMRSGFSFLWALPVSLPLIKLFEVFKS